MSANIFLATTSSGLSRAVPDGAGSWKVETTLLGTQVACLAAGPRSVYAGLRSGGLLRSDDLGRSWQPAGLENIPLRALAVSPHNPDVLYAGAKPVGLYVSRDAGASWDELPALRRARRWYWFSPAEFPFSPYVQALAVSPKDPDSILAGIEAGAVLHSLDGGRTWSPHRKGALRDCHTLTFHNAHGAWVYEAGGSGAGISFSTDGGRTWLQPKQGLPPLYGWAVAADSGSPEVYYFSASTAFPSKGVPQAHIDGDARAHIYRKRGEAPWERLAGGLPQPLDYMAYALLTDPDEPGALYAGLSSGDVWCSADHGDRWERLPFSLGGIHRTLIRI